MTVRSADDVRDFFAWSEWLDRAVLRPLSHIASNWEVRWSHSERRYVPEPHSFADDLNAVIDLIAVCPPPSRYHDHEDVIAERVVQDLKWPIQKKGGRWVGEDYAAILEQGAFRDLDQRDLIAAASGRVRAALAYGQEQFDEMEDGHFSMLAALMTIIIYHRDCDGVSLLTEED